MESIWAAAKQYDISLKRAGGAAIWPRLSYFASVFFVVFFVQWAWDTFVPFWHGAQKSAFEQLLLPTWLAFWLTILERSRRTSLTIGEDFVERQTSFGTYTITKRISRLQAKSVEEIKLKRQGGMTMTGLAVRDRGKIGTWLFGFVFVPASIPAQDYEEAKTRLLRWNLPKTSGEHLLSS